ncbi:MAG: OmpA family protein [Burkholderiales bacterium]|nr:OmpA family protein [Burkholderiales bacterium]
MKLNRICILGMLIVLFAACSSTTPPPSSQPQEVVLINVTSYYNSIWFDNNSTAISSDFDSILMLNANYLITNPLAQVQIQGNASEIGSKERNKLLAVNRARAVANKLIALGVNPSQIQQISFDISRPIFPSDNKGHSPKNRRVDIIYISGAPLTYYIDKLPLVSTEDETIEFDPMNVKEQRQKYQQINNSSTSSPANTTSTTTVMLQDDTTPFAATSAIISSSPVSNSPIISSAPVANAPTPPTIIPADTPTPDSIGALPGN